MSTSGNSKKIQYILNNSTGIELMRKNFCKSYYNLAWIEFKKQYKRQFNPESVEDCQKLYDIYEQEWRGYYIDKPLATKKARIVGAPVWKFGIKYKIDVYAAMCRFLEYKMSVFVPASYQDFQHIDFYVGWEGKNGRYEKNAGELMKELGIQHKDQWIMESGLYGEWCWFIMKNRKFLKKHYKQTYEDYSHLAYSGVTDDF